jgi:S1-C subfamily serine protease
MEFEEMVKTGQISVADLLALSTARLNCFCTDGTESIGSGFFFEFATEGDTTVLAIVTNKHVVQNAKRIQFTVHLKDEKGSPSFTKFQEIEISHPKLKIAFHPNHNIDLCAILVGESTRSLHENNSIGCVALEFDSLDSVDDLKLLSTIEEVIMIGYPNGISDSKHSMPITRRGITATHPNLPYEGRNEFLVDMACFPGSSGSPVFHYQVGTFRSSPNTMSIGTKMSLLGILYAGPVFTVEGELKILPIQTIPGLISVSDIQMHLGMVIRASELYVLDQEVRRIA